MFLQEMFYLCFKCIEHLNGCGYAMHYTIDIPSLKINDIKPIHGTQEDGTDGYFFDNRILF